MNLKLLMLAVAGACGLAAFYGASRMMRRGPSRVETQKVVVAARDIKVEEVLKAECLVVVEKDKASLPPGTTASPLDVEGRWVKVPVLEGEPIIERKLAEKGSPPGMVSRIPRGMRAYAIDVTEQTGVSGFILPDHRVDVMHSTAGSDGRSEAVPILQDVLILASGTTFTRPEDRSIQSRTVTLAVSPEQVEVLVAARAAGSLSLALRGLNDHDKSAPRRKPEPPPPVLKPVEVVKRAPETPPAARPRPRVVAVYRGGGRQSRDDVSHVPLGSASRPADEPAQPNPPPSLAADLPVGPPLYPYPSGFGAGVAPYSASPALAPYFGMPGAGPAFVIPGAGPRGFGP